MGEVFFRKTDVIKSEMDVITTATSVLKKLESGVSSDVKSSSVIPEGYLQVNKDEDSSVLIRRGLLFSNSEVNTPVTESKSAEVPAVEEPAVEEPAVKEPAVKESKGLLAKFAHLISQIFKHVKNFAGSIFGTNEVSINVTSEASGSEVEVTDSHVVLVNVMPEQEAIRNPEVRKYFAKLDVLLFNAKLKEHTELFEGLAASFNDPNSSNDARRALLSDALATIRTARDSLYNEVPHNKERFARTLNAFQVIADLLCSAVEGRDDLNVSVPMICELVLTLIEENNRFLETIDTNVGGVMSGTMKLDALAPGSITASCHCYSSSFENIVDPVITIADRCDNIIDHVTTVDGKGVVHIAPRSWVMIGDWIKSTAVTYECRRTLKELESVYRKTDMDDSAKNALFDEHVGVLRVLCGKFFLDPAGDGKFTVFERRHRSSAIARDFILSSESLCKTESSGQGTSEKEKSIGRQSWVQSNLSRFVDLHNEDMRYNNPLYYAIEKDLNRLPHKAMLSGTMLSPEFALGSTPRDLLTAQSPTTSQNTDVSSVVTDAMSSGLQTKVPVDVSMQGA